MTHLIALGPPYQALKTKFFAADGNRPSEAEVFVCSLLMAYSIGASEVLQLLDAMQQRSLQANMMRFNAIVHASREGSARW